MAPEPGQITLLLKRTRTGDIDAQSLLFEYIYSDLKRLATVLLARESTARSLQPTVLVHEAYLRIPQMDIDWQDRNHFFAVSARAMRRILIDHARARSTSKRPNERNRAELTDAVTAVHEDPALLITFDVVLKELEQLDERQARIVEMKFFLGMTEDEVAPIVDLSVRQVRREWQMARVWLHNRLEEVGYV